MRKTRAQTKVLDSDIAEAKTYIQLFRVCDLQEFLTATKSKQIGRKGELVERAIEVITEFRNPALIEHIRQIYKRNEKFLIQPTAQSISPAPTVTNNPAINYTINPSVPSKVSLPVASVAPILTPAMYQQHIPGQDANRGVVHANGVVVAPYQNMSGFPIHPDVRLRKLAFFDVLGTLLRPSTLVPNNNANRIQEATFYFHLTPQQATDIASNRDIRNGSKIEHTIQVQLRFCLLETSCEQEDYFPPNVVVKVNNKLCNLPNPIPTNKPGVEPKRPPRPVNVTPNVKLSPTVPNHISVSWCTEFQRNYVISVYLVRKLTSAQLLHRLKTKGIKPADFTRGLIKEKLNEDADSEIATTMLKVSLICPLGKMRMATPCRSSTCSHLQCFDASLYLQMNERKPTWNCPVCDKAGLYENLVVDGYFQEVLVSSLLTSDDSEIQLHKDGSWSTHINRNDTQIIDTPQKPMQKVEVISDDLEVITTDPPKASINPIAAALGFEPTSTTNETVDLTLSDSDDDDLPLKRKLPQQKAPPPPPAVSVIPKAKPNANIVNEERPKPIQGRVYISQEHLAKWKASQSTARVEQMQRELDARLKEMRVKEMEKLSRARRAGIVDAHRRIQVSESQPETQVRNGGNVVEAHRRRIIFEIPVQDSRTVAVVNSQQNIPAQKKQN